MNTRTSLLLIAGACVAACGGKTIDTDSSGTTSQQAKGGQGDQTSSGVPQGSTTMSPPATGTVVVSPSPHSCTESGSSASGGAGANGDMTCQSESSFQCSDGELAIKCGCSQTNGVWNPGECGCSPSGTSFTFDCSKGCQPGAAEYAKCNIPDSAWK